MHITVLTLFPEIFPGPLGVSLLGRALENKIWSLKTVSLKDYGIGPHKTVDDACYSGGAGMVIRPDIIDSALVDATCCVDNFTCVYMTPRGSLMKDAMLKTYATPGHNIIVLCGRYEGVDQRVLEHWNFQEICLGDFVLCGGDIPAMAFIEGCVRYLPGVVGNAQSVASESFCHDLLEHPQYTRPKIWKEKGVPEVLTSGHHAKIAQWKKVLSEQHTKKIRPDLWSKYKNH